MKLAVLSNVTMAPLEGFFPGAVFSEYNQYIQELIHHDLIRTHDPDVVWLHLEAKEMAGDFYFQMFGNERAQAERTVLEQADQWISLLVNTAGKHPDICFIVSTLVFPPDQPGAYLADAPMAALEDALNTRLKNAAGEHSNVLVLDINQRIFRSHGWGEIVDPRFWYLGRIPYTQKGFESFAREITQLTHAHRGKSKKVLVLDLDNTLWGGVVGEDGLDGIALSEDGMGKAFRDFQREIKALQSMGVLLTLCSKNNGADALEVFDAHPMMVLEKQDLAAMEINWEPKAANIQRLAHRLNLGLDAFVFIDDNPVERELVRTTLPQVIVPEFPKEPTDLASWFLQEVVLAHFPKRNLTREDLGKTEQYQKNAQRKDLAQTLDMDTFIQNLNISLTIHDTPQNLVHRLAQMTQKTNQFNLTTRRYTETDIQDFMAAGDCAIFALEYEDKFGKEGIVGEAIVRREGKIARLDTFLLSCRVIGRRVEEDFFRHIIRHLPGEIETVLGEYIPTLKNTMVEDFYPRMGLTPQPGDGPHQFTGSISALLQSMEEK